jgi:hypothetical protein
MMFSHSSKLEDGAMEGAWRRWWCVDDDDDDDEDDVFIIIISSRWPSGGEYQERCWGGMMSTRSLDAMR